MFKTNKDILAIIQDVEEKTVDNRVNHECFEAKTSEALSKIQLAIKEAAGNFEEIEDKHNSLVLEVSEGIKDIQERLDILEQRYDLLNRYDDVNREKFDALCKHFNVFFRNKPQECVIQPVDDDDSACYSKA